MACTTCRPTTACSGRRFAPPLMPNVRHTAPLSPTSPSMAAQGLFARRVFFFSGVYGIIVLTLQYLVELGFGPPLPAPIQRPEQFYGFIGVALAWQVVFLAIARDVVRYRLLMLPAILEKLVFGVPVLLLYAADRVGSGCAGLRVHRPRARRAVPPRVPRHPRRRGRRLTVLRTDGRVTAGASTDRRGETARLDRSSAPQAPAPH